MPSLGIEADGDVFEPRALERVDAAQHALGHTADRVLAAGDEEQRQLLIHLVEVLRLLVHLHARQKIAREADRRIKAAERIGVRADVGQVFTADQFYNDNPEAGEMYRKFGILALEMEAAGLYWTAQRLGKRALAICTISDSLITGEELPAADRQTTFTQMMEIALGVAVEMEKK